MMHPDGPGFKLDDEKYRPQATKTTERCTMIATMDDLLPFASRREAGEHLAARLNHFHGRRSAVVVGVIRGGIATGRALADALHLHLYPYVVRKLGHPARREYGLGAMAEHGATSIDEEMMRLHGIAWEDMEPVIDEERAELRRHSEVFLTHARPPLSGKTVLLTDDGAATGNTLLAAIADIREEKPAEIIVALPVCPPETAKRLAQRADDIAILATPHTFEAVGRYYQDFPPLTDDEVLSLLRRA